MHPFHLVVIGSHYSRHRRRRCRLRPPGRPGPPGRGRPGSPGTNRIRGRRAFDVQRPACVDAWLQLLACK